MAAAVTAAAAATAAADTAVTAAADMMTVAAAVGERKGGDANFHGNESASHPFVIPGDLARGEREKEGENSRLSSISKTNRINKKSLDSQSQIRKQ